MSNHAVKNTRSLKTLKAYVVGLVLAFMLTLMSFGIVARDMFSRTEMIIVLMTLAVIQLFVQVVCFLRLNNSREGKWELMPFIFTIFIVLVIVIGSLWIMFSLNYNMMH